MEIISIARARLNDPSRPLATPLLLFDEIEKTHPNVIDLLLQVLGEGCLPELRTTGVFDTSSLTPAQTRYLLVQEELRSLRELYEELMAADAEVEMNEAIDEVFQTHDSGGWQIVLQER